MHNVSDVCQRHYMKALSFYNELRNCEDIFIRDSINTALDNLGDALRLYGPEHLLSSYNGGKDADIVMHLLRAAIAKYSLDNNTVFVPKMVYFSVEDEFSEVLEHIGLSEQLFDLQLKRYNCGIIEGIKQHAEENKGCHPAFVLGTRRGDPNCGNQETFAPSSAWMPVAFMRVNPIIEWSYGQVWHFLRLFKLPYCKLYDEGYTSLGQRGNTLKNPFLRLSSSSSSSSGDSYLPAYMLSNWNEERAGRITTKKASQTVTVVSETTTESGKSLSPASEENQVSEADTPIVGRVGVYVLWNSKISDIASVYNNCQSLVTSIGANLFSFQGCDANATAEVITAMKSRMPSSGITYIVCVVSDDDIEKVTGDLVDDIISAVDISKIDGQECNSHFSKEKLQKLALGLTESSALMWGDVCILRSRNGQLHEAFGVLTQKFLKTKRCKIITTLGPEELRVILDRVKPQLGMYESLCIQSTGVLTDITVKYTLDDGLEHILALFMMLCPTGSILQVQREVA